MPETSQLYGTWHSILAPSGIYTYMVCNIPDTCTHEIKIIKINKYFKSCLFIRENTTSYFLIKEKSKILILAFIPFDKKKKQYTWGISANFLIRGSFLLSLWVTYQYKWKPSRTKYGKEENSNILNGLLHTLLSRASDV